jgi:hypothetical protein
MVFSLNGGSPPSPHIWGLFSPGRDLASIVLGPMEQAATSDACWSIGVEWEWELEWTR